jgi:hypothetical protein
MSLVERIIAYVQNHHPLSYTQLAGVVLAKGFTELELLQALDQVHKDKRITQTVRRGEISYSPYIAPPVVPPPAHLLWIESHYIRPHNCQHNTEYTSCEHCAPFPEISYSFLFLKTKEERDNFKALASGRPVYMIKNKYEKRK